MPGDHVGILAVGKAIEAGYVPNGASGYAAVSYAARMKTQYRRHKRKAPTRICFATWDRESLDTALF